MEWEGAKTGTEGTVVAKAKRLAHLARPQLKSSMFPGGMGCVET